MKPLKLLGTALLATAAVALIASAKDKERPYPVETGPAKFLRNHDEALALAKETGKPVFLFFQEVPG